MRDRPKKAKSYQDVINKALEIFHDKEKVYEWYLKPSNIFDGMSPYQYMKTHSVIAVLRILETFEIGIAKKKARK